MSIFVPDEDDPEEFVRALIKQDERNAKIGWSGPPKKQRYPEYRYVAHHHIETFKECGWVVVDDLSDTHHGHYAVLMGKVE